MLERRNDLEMAAYTRAGLIAATIVNVYRKPGSPMARPSDFIRTSRRKAEDYMDVATAQMFLDGWVKEQNKLAGENG